MDCSSSSLRMLYISFILRLYRLKCTSLRSGITIFYKVRIKKELSISVFHTARCLFFFPIKLLYFFFISFKYKAFQCCHLCSLLTINSFLLFSLYASLPEPFLYIHSKLHVLASTFCAFPFRFPDT